MSPRTLHRLLLVAVMAVITAAIRFLPFLLFRKDSAMPKTLRYLADKLPGAVIGMLVIYCFKSTTVTAWPFGLPELIASLAVCGVYWWRRNALIAIGGGTVLYMLLVQVVFR